MNNRVAPGCGTLAVHEQKEIRMREGATYPEYIGISDISTQSFEQMRVEGFF